MFLQATALAMLLAMLFLVPYGNWIDRAENTNIMDLMLLNIVLLQLTVVSQLFFTTYIPLFVAATGMIFMNSLVTVCLPPLMATILAPLNRPDSVAIDLSFANTPFAFAGMLNMVFGSVLARFPDYGAAHASTGRIPYSAEGYQLLYVVVPLTLLFCVNLPSFLWIRSKNAMPVEARLFLV